MRKGIVCLILLLFIGLLSGCKSQTTVNNYNDDKFKPGQVWQYNTRTGEEKSTFIVLKVEKDSTMGVIVHIAVNDVNLKTGSGEMMHEVGHLPLSREAVEKSVIKILRTQTNLPDYHEGYEQWKSAFVQGKAGIWSVSVSEALSAMEQALSKK